MEQASSAFSTGVPALAAIPQLAGNSRQGFGPVDGTMHWTSGWVISSNTLGLSTSLYDSDAGSRSTGKERDAESGNDYFEARYYSSAMGRFMSPDWSAKEEPVPYAKLDDPQSLNLYAYVLNNPLVRTDPDGHCCLDEATADEALQMVEESSAGQAIANFVGGAVNAGFAWGSGVAKAVWDANVNSGGPALSANGYPTKLYSSNANAPASASTPAPTAAPAPAASTGQSKTAEEMAADLSKSAGTNSVPYQTPSVSGHIDLAGKGHFDKATGQTIPTPHVQERPKSVGPNGKVNVGKQTTRPATKQDVRTAKKLLGQ